jgi:hypothetical protein
VGDDLTVSSRLLLTVPALACATVLGVSACGSGGGSSSASSSSSGNGTAAAAPTKVTAKGGGDFCKQLADSLNDTKNVSAKAFTGNPADLKTLVDQAKARIPEIVATAPSAIKDDVKTLITATTSYYDALSAAGYDFKKLDPTKLTSFTAPQVVQASQRVDAYIQSHCGIDIGASATP